MRKIIVLCLMTLAAASFGKENTMNMLGSKVITQIGLVVKDIDKTSKAYASLFGMDVPDIIITDPVEQAHTEYRGESTKAQAKLAFFHFENITIELIEPIGTASTWWEFLDTHGEGVHHIAFQIEGMEEWITVLKQNNMPMVQKGDFTGGSYAYIDSAPQLGVMLELLTSDDAE